MGALPLLPPLLPLLLLAAALPECLARCALRAGRPGHGVAARRCAALSQGRCVPGAACSVRAAVLLPADASRFEVALPRVLPVMDMAAQAAAELGLWPRGLLSFQPGDDQCEAVHGQITAVDSYAHDCADVFFGPTCEYSVAPVGRMVKFWNTPLLTVGAFTHDFSSKKTTCEDEYYMLTRVGSLSFRDVAFFLLAVMDQYSWRRVMLVYDKNGYLNLSGEHTCKLMMESLVKLLKQREMQYGSLDTERAANQSIKDHLKREVGNEFSGSRPPPASCRPWRLHTPDPQDAPTAHPPSRHPGRPKPGASVPGSNS